jgi:hypothetical protein
LSGFRFSNISKVAQTVLTQHKPNTLKLLGVLQHVELWDVLETLGGWFALLKQKH